MEYFLSQVPLQGDGTTTFQINGDVQYIKAFLHIYGHPHFNLPRLVMALPLKLLYESGKSRMD